ncbi:MAG: response regulator [Terrimonas sp.]|nr:response regulator [Terrimonas sp.]
MKTYKNVLFVIVFSFFVLAFFIWQTRRNIANNAASNEAFQQLNNQLQNINDFNAQLASTESSSLNYILTGDEYYAEKFRDDSTGLMNSITTMSSTYTGHPEQVANIETLKNMVMEKLQLNAAIINMPRGQALVQGQVPSIEKKRVTNKINLQLSKISRYNEILFENNINRFDAASRNYYLTTLIICLVTFLIVYFMLTRISEQIRRRKRAEFEAQVNESKYKELINQSGVILFTSNVSGEFTFVSNYAKKVTGYDSDELIGKSFLMLIDKEWKSTVINFYQHMIENRLSESSIKFPIVTKEGENKWMDQQAVLLMENGVPTGFQCITKDVTEIYLLDEERTKRNQERKESHLLLQSILDNCPQIIFIKDNKGRYVQVNNQFVEVLNLNPNHIIGCTDEMLFGDEIAGKFLRFEKKIFEAQKAVEVKQDILYRDEVRKYSFVIFPLFDPEGKILGLSGIGTDITENVNNHKKLIEAVKKAEHAEKLKESFLANMSHEIRTPLNAIIGFGTQMMKTDMTEKQRGFLQNINSASEHLLVLINDILDISKIEEGKLSLEHIDFDFKEVIQESIAVLSHKAEEKGLVLETHTDERINRFLKGDPHRLKQILLNLLGNSIKFTEKGSVQVNCQLAEDRPGQQLVRLEVIDTGVGIEKEYLANLFDKFSQEDRSVTRKYGGTGLGMSITKYLVELKGGTIDVESEKNVGTRITIVFPLEKTEVTSIANPEYISPDINKLSNCRILVVDDVEMNRLVASAVLSEYGVVITEAENGADAIQKLRESTFDMVLMDLQMPVMDGLNATRIIRNELKLQLPVIALTASAMRRDNEKCFEAGMNDYVTKPFNEEDLITVIQKHLVDLPIA